MNDIDRRIAELGLTLPDAPAPVANYTPTVIAGSLLHVSGQISNSPSGVIRGRLGDTASIEDGYAAARMCALNVVAQIRKALNGDLTRVHRIVRLGVFINAAPDFADHPKVANGASDLVVAIFGDRGKHARAAVGAVSLPLGAAVEVDATIEVSAAMQSDK